MSTDSPSQHKILIVEDEAVIAMEIESRMTRMGYQVVGPASTGERALALARESRPDIALMDINIQGPIDGIQTAATLQEQMGIPAVFLTAYSDDATLERATGAGPLGYLTKPFSDRDIRAAVEVAIHRRDKERELKRKQIELELTVAQLKKALSEVRVLKSLLPICAGCKKIRDDQGYWSAVDAYIINQGLTNVTHGLCPDCVDRLYPEVADAVNRPKPE